MHAQQRIVILLTYCCRMAFFKKNSIKKIAINEAFFNYVFVWPMVELSAETTNNSDISFVPGEYILHSSVEEYKADAVVLLEQYDVELCLVGTSGAYKINDAPRFGYDHVKGCFGALTLLNAIIKKYHNAKLDSILRLVIPFMHIRGTQIMHMACKFNLNNMIFFNFRYRRLCTLVGA